MQRVPEPVTPPKSAIPANVLHLVGEARQGGVMRGTVWTGATGLTLDGQPVPFDDEGNFIIAFDRDAEPQALLVTRLPGGDVVQKSLTVAKGDWRIEHVNAALTGGAATSAEFQRRRAGELEQIRAARAATNASDGWRETFIWPVQARISGRFGSQRIYRGTPGSYHTGVDLAGGAGAIYVAPADGVVVLAASSPFTLEGNLLMIDHGMGLNSAFLHASKLLVKEGDKVRQGQPLGVIGATGRASGPHLHWGMKWRDARIDPALLVGGAADH